MDCWTLQAEVVFCTFHFVLKKEVCFCLNPIPVNGLQRELFCRSLRFRWEQEGNQHYHAGVSFPLHDWSFAALFVALWCRLLLYVWLVLMFNHWSAMLELSHSFLRPTDGSHSTHSSLVFVPAGWELSNRSTSYRSLWTDSHFNFYLIVDKDMLIR